MVRKGVDPEDAAQFDLRGNEAINLVGDYEDFVGNNSTGRIIGGVSMGGARDTLNNSGLDQRDRRLGDRHGRRQRPGEPLCRRDG